MATHCTSSCTDKSQAAMASTGMNWLICVMEVRCWHTQAAKELGLLRGLSPGSRFSEFCPYQLGLILVQHSMGRRTSGTPPTGRPVFTSGNYKQQPRSSSKGMSGGRAKPRENIHGQPPLPKKSLFGKAKVKAIR